MDEFRLLGPLEAVVDGKPVQLAAAKPRALLALLLQTLVRASKSGVTGPPGAAANPSRRPMRVRA